MDRSFRISSFGPQDPQLTCIRRFIRSMVVQRMLQHGISIFIWCPNLWSTTKHSLLFTVTPSRPGVRDPLQLHYFTRSSPSSKTTHPICTPFSVSPPSWASLPPRPTRPLSPTTAQATPSARPTATPTPPPAASTPSPATPPRYPRTCSVLAQVQALVPLAALATS